MEFEEYAIKTAERHAVIQYIKQCVDAIISLKIMMQRDTRYFPLFLQLPTIKLR